MRRRTPPATLIAVLVPLLSACADHLVAPGKPQPNPQIAELLRRAPQDMPVAIAEVKQDDASEFFLARGRLTGPGRSPGEAFMRMDFQESDLAFVIRPGGGRYTLNAPNTRQITWSFYCYDWDTNRWVAQQSVRVNRARQVAIANTGGHGTRHNLDTKPVGRWSPESSTAFASTFTSTITSGIAAGDEVVQFETTVNDAGDCQGEVVFEALSATRWPGLVLMTGLQMAPISSNHTSVYYATPQMAQQAIAANNFYREAAGAAFTVTAAALIYGGINDVRFNWTNPHVTHRVGTDLDIDGSADTPRVWNRLIAAGRRAGFAKCEPHNGNHVHCYAVQY